MRKKTMMTDQKKPPDNPVLSVVKTAKPVNAKGEPDKWADRRSDSFMVQDGRIWFMRKGRDSKKAGDDQAPQINEIPTALGVARAVLGEVLPIDFSLFLAGRSGSQKSECAAALACFGSFDARSFTDTEADLEHKAHQAKDAAFSVDDFAPQCEQSRGQPTAHQGRTAVKISRQPGRAGAAECRHDRPGGLLSARAGHLAAAMAGFNPERSATKTTGLVPVFLCRRAGGFFSKGRGRNKSFKGVTAVDTEAELPSMRNPRKDPQAWRCWLIVRFVVAPTEQSPRAGQVVSMGAGAWPALLSAKKKPVALVGLPAFLCGLSG